jgi:hypothetical protein
MTARRPMIKYRIFRRFSSRISLKKLTSFSGSMLFQTELIDEDLNFFGLPVNISQPLARRKFREPEKVLGKLALAPYRNVLEGFWIHNLLAHHLFSSIENILPFFEEILNLKAFPFLRVTVSRRHRVIASLNIWIG